MHPAGRRKESDNGGAGSQLNAHKGACVRDMIDMIDMIDDGNGDDDDDW